MKAIGMMSGTSLDGITVALASTGLNGENFKILSFETYPFSKKIRAFIEKVIEKGGTEEISFLNFYIGKLYANAVKEFMEEKKISRKEIDVIGMHGQTVFHTEKTRSLCGISVKGHTLQIGEPAFVARETGLTVVSNFRPKDMAAGGKGAPLIPLFDFLVFSKKGKRIAVQNLGGIGNVTFLSGKKLSSVFAFDTGPCNMLLDGAMKLLYGKNFDKDGKIASSGKIIEKLFAELKKTPYLKKKPPKSTGRSEFGEHFLKKALKGFEKERKSDIIATLNKFVAFTIFKSYEDFLPEIDYAVLSGGGVFNKTLVSNIKNYLKVPVYVSDEFGVPAEAKEAGAFALYALRTIHGRFSDLPGATGAKEKQILGDITYAG